MTGEWRQSKGVSTILCYCYCTAVLQGPPRQSGVLKTSLLKVSKFQNEFMKLFFLPKYEQNIVRISALCSAVLQGRNLDNFLFIFWEKDDFINSFWDLLTFSKKYLNIYPNHDWNLIRRLNIFHLNPYLLTKSQKVQLGQNLCVWSLWKSNLILSWNISSLLMRY